MPRYVVIDSCCILNLLATRREIEIVRGLDLHLVNTPQVNAETITLWTPPDADGQRSRELASTDALRHHGYLETRELSGLALIDAFMSAAALITDTDASCIALAGVNKWPLMTDDRKERRIARDLFPAIELISTLDVFADAARTLGWSTQDVRQAAQDLRRRGNFAPPRFDPHARWYETLLAR